MRILVIEDEHKIANSIKKGLELESYAVDVAFTGNEGYDLAITEEYDLIILGIITRNPKTVGNRSGSNNRNKKQANGDFNSAEFGNTECFRSCRVFFGRKNSAAD